jgi:vacuolar-type H+-ATPase subunit E/Vma4
METEIKRGDNVIIINKNKRGVVSDILEQGYKTYYLILFYNGETYLSSTDQIELDYEIKKFKLL